MVWIPKFEFCFSILDHSRHCHSLKLRRILAIVPHVVQETGERPNDIELRMLNPVNQYRSFYLHIVVKKGNHKWQHRKVLVECPSVEVGSKWFTFIENILKGIKLFLPCKMVSGHGHCPLDILSD